MMLYRKRRLKLAVLVVIYVGYLVSLSGCGVGRAMVIQPPASRVTISTVQASEGNSPVPVPTDVKADFSAKLEKYLFGEDGFQKGPELTISYRFIQYDPGSQFTRWFWGGIGNAGEVR